MTRRGAPARARAPRDPYGIGPVVGFVGPIVAIVVLAVVAALTLSLLNGQIPFVKTATSGGGDGGTNGGAQPTPAPSGVVIAPPEAIFPGSIVYAKAGNIWIQTGEVVQQLTSTGRDSMPAFSADGKWIYFVRINRTGGKFPTGGSAFQGRSWYDLDTPELVRMKPDGSGTTRLLTGKFSQGSSTWFYWLRQPTPSPDGKTVTVISDGPNPLQSDIVLHQFGIASKKLTSLKLPESLHLGHQDPAWRLDGRFLLYVKNGRELTRGAPQIFRYDPATKKTRVLTGPGYIAPAYSPDGQWIAATKTDAFGTDIAILDQLGKEVLRITDDAHSFSPVWSPAGNAVAFLHLEGTIVDLRMAKLDNATGRWVVSSVVDLTKVSGLDGASRPSWYIPPSGVPAPSAAPGASGSPVASPSASTSP
jgi:dipeptidyl aminopeptidase/acylaminoacyl peptidase